MTPKRRENLQRLLKPRHIAAIGGADVAVVAGECKRIGFDGAFWPVNPKRTEIAGHPCYASVDDLPEAPDAVFLAIPRDPAIETLRKLRDMGAGGVVCYTAGFSETGPDGAVLEQRLINAAGDLALIGPNCYGLINYVDRVALWPFAHGGSCPGYGAAIITQSGMLSSDLTMSQRSVPFAYMISAGNQSVLRVEDFIGLLVDDDKVRAIGIHIEGLQDVHAFERGARRALEAGKPIVALKSGTSKIGGQLTVSHTGSLSGTDDLYQALFDRLGIIRVHNPAALLETLKFICVSGLPKGNRIAGFTCSGGGATMLADHAEKIGLDFAQPSNAAATKLRDRLPDIATVSNPLDYTTPIWGDPERVPPVFNALLADGYDSAILVQDYPLPELDDSKVFYLNDAKSFIASATRSGIPATVCSTLPENLDHETRAMLIAAGVTPGQGIHETLEAIQAATQYQLDRKRILAGLNLELVAGGSSATSSRTIDEWEGKQVLKNAGIQIPQGLMVTGDEAAAAAEQLGFPVALKMVHADLAHKTEAGAVVVGLKTQSDVNQAVRRMQADVTERKPTCLSDRFLVERMVEGNIIELLVSVRRDPDFGLAMTIATGGILVDLFDDAQTVLLPASQEQINRALTSLRSAPLFEGYRGSASVDMKELEDVITKLADLAVAQQDHIVEIEINPLFVTDKHAVAVDALIQVAC